MRHLLFILIVLISQTSYSSQDHMADTFHHRMILREPHIYQGARIYQSQNLSQEVLDLQERELDTLLHFAKEYDLFKVGFSYGLYPISYTIENEGETIGYSFSITIFKHNKPFSRRFYLLAKRVDGIFYTGHIATYDY